MAASEMSEPSVSRSKIRTTTVADYEDAEKVWAAAAEATIYDRTSDLQTKFTAAGASGTTSRVHMQGWLVKRGEHFHSWRRRYFVLRTGTLTYFETPESVTPMNELAVAGASADPVDDRKYKKPFCFELSIPNNNRVFILMASCASERDAWIDAFKEQVLVGRRQRSAEHAKKKMVICNITNAETLIDKAGTSFTVYSIRVQTGQLMWVVRRRFSEFEKLHEDLCAQHKDAMGSKHVPEFPRKNVFTASTDQKVVDSRMVIFDHYIKALVAVPDIARSVPLLTFLGLLKDRSTNESSASHANVSNEVVMGMLDVGDIMLMRTPTSLATMQRTVFRSDWDHVGIVIRVPMTSTRPDSLMLLEAVGSGVVMFPLLSRLESFQQYKQVVAIRKLQWQRTASALRQLETFCDDCVGKKYSLSSLVTGGGDTETFYCAGLVYHCLAAMGIVKQHSSVRWMPGDFSQRKQKVKLLNGAYWESELLINFQQDATSHVPTDLHSAMVAAATAERSGEKTPVARSSNASAAEQKLDPSLVNGLIEHLPSLIKHEQHSRMKTDIAYGARAAKADAFEAQSENLARRRRRSNSFDDVVEIEDVEDRLSDDDDTPTLTAARDDYLQVIRTRSMEPSLSKFGRRRSSFPALGSIQPLNADRSIVKLRGGPGGAGHPGQRSKKLAAMLGDDYAKSAASGGHSQGPGQGSGAPQKSKKLMEMLGEEYRAAPVSEQNGNSREERAPVGGPANMVGRGNSSKMAKLLGADMGSAAPVSSQPKNIAASSSSGSRGSNGSDNGSGNGFSKARSGASKGLGRHGALSDRVEIAPEALEEEEEDDLAELALPPGWTEHFTAGIPYYHNKDTGETVWEHPARKEQDKLKAQQADETARKKSALQEQSTDKATAADVPLDIADAIPVPLASPPAPPTDAKSRRNKKLAAMMGADVLSATK